MCSFMENTGLDVSLSHSPAQDANTYPGRKCVKLAQPKARPRERSHNCSRTLRSMNAKHSLRKRDDSFLLALPHSDAESSDDVANHMICIRIHLSTSYTSSTWCYSNDGVCTNPDTVQMEDIFYVKFNGVANQCAGQIPKGQTNTTARSD